MVEELRDNAEFHRNKCAAESAAALPNTQSLRMCVAVTSVRKSRRTESDLTRGQVKLIR